MSRKVIKKASVRTTPTNGQGVWLGQVEIFKNSKLEKPFGRFRALLAHVKCWGIPRIPKNVKILTFKTLKP